MKVIKVKVKSHLGKVNDKLFEHKLHTILLKKIKF